MNKPHTVLTEDQLAVWAQELAPTLQPGDNLYLSGELGSGKTTFTRYLLEALDSEVAASSPTFTLLNLHELPAGTPVVHADLYRLTAPEDVLSLGLLEQLESPDTLVIVEWPERAEQLLPSPTKHLHFSHHTPETRVISDLTT